MHRLVDSPNNQRVHLCIHHATHRLYMLLQMQYACEQLVVVVNMEGSLLQDEC